MKSNKWFKIWFISIFILSSLVFTLNLIVDPYSLTSKNLLHIPNKFTGDDRTEKVTNLLTHDSYDNILFGSSRVYSINPLMLSKYVGGTTYNTGVGTARMEDHLGFLLLLQRNKKLPKKIILGLDFYTFNPKLKPNSYFLKNSDLNFLHGTTENSLYLNKFFSIDATIASIKTLNNFILSPSQKPRFDQFGAAHNASDNFNYYPKAQKQQVFSDKRLLNDLNFIRSEQYQVLSETRFQYLNKFITICDDNNITLKIFTTPLAGGLLAKINSDTQLNNMLNLFKIKLQKTTSYNDFLTHNKIINTPVFFNNPTHTKTTTGNLMLAKLYDDEKISLPQDFGIQRLKP